MRSVEYTVTLERNEDGGYTVSVPALRGCVTQGHTVAEALRRAKEAVECHLEALTSLGERLPQDRKVLHLNTNEFSEVLVCKVHVRPAGGAAKKGVRIA
jgi:predicted RNase H-like HicB family nuclease